MNHFILLFISLTCFFSGGKDVDSKSEKIIGQWTLVKTKTTSPVVNGRFDVSESGAVNPMSVTFNADGSAAIKHRDGTEEDYRWKIKGGKITISHTGEGFHTIIYEGIFSMSFSEESTTLELIRDKYFSIFLRR